MDKISDLKQIVINTLDINKAQDIVSIDLKDKSSMADFMIIASGALRHRAPLLACLWRRRSSDCVGCGLDCVGSSERAGSSLLVPSRPSPWWSPLSDGRGIGIV